MADPLGAIRSARTEISQSSELREECVGLARELSAAPVTRPHWRKRWVPVLVAGAILAPSAAAATYVSLHTGYFGDPAKNTEDSTSGEYLNVCSPQWLGLIAEHRPSSALPTGWTWDRAEQRFVADAESNPDCVGGSGAAEQEIGIESRYAFYAKCAWTAAGMEAIKKGNRADYERAGAELLRLATSKLNHDIDGGGVVTLDTEVAEAIGVGRAERVVLDYYRANCGGVR